MAQLYDANSNPFLTDVLAQAQSLGSLNATVTSQMRGQTTVFIQVTAIGSLTLAFEGNVDGTNWFAVNMFPYPTFGASVQTTTANGQWVSNIAGLYQFRTRVSAYTSGTVLVSQNIAQGSNEQEIQTGVPQATATAGLLGQLVQGAVTTAAPSYTTAQTDPVSLTVAGGLRSDLASVNATALGTPTNFGTTPGAVAALQVNSSAFIGTTVAVAASAGVQKVGISGNAGASVDAVSGAAVPANGLLVAGGSIAGGTNLTPLTVKAASTAGVATDTSLVVQPLIRNVQMAIAAAGVQQVGVVGNAGAIFDAATAAAVPANAVQVGGRAATSNPTNLTNAQLGSPMIDHGGRLVVTRGHIRELCKIQATTLAASTETTIITAGGASVFNDLAWIIISTAGIAAATFTIRDVTAAGTPWILDYPGLAAWAGIPIQMRFDPPISQGTANSAWTVTCSVATTAHITCGYIQNL